VLIFSQCIFTDLGNNFPSVSQLVGIIPCSNFRPPRASGLPLPGNFRNCTETTRK